MDGIREQQDEGKSARPEGYRLQRITTQVSEERTADGWISTPPTVKGGRVWEGYGWRSCRLRWRVSGRDLGLACRKQQPKQSLSAESLMHGGSTKLCRFGQEMVRRERKTSAVLLGLGRLLAVRPKCRRSMPDRDRCASRLWTDFRLLPSPDARDCRQALAPASARLAAPTRRHSIPTIPTC